MSRNQSEATTPDAMAPLRLEVVGRGPDRGPSQPARPRRPGARTIRVVLGLTWILAGALQFQPFMFSKGFLAQVVAPVSQGQPGWIAATITWSVQVMGHHHVVCNALFATTQVLIGAGLLFRRSTKAALLASFGWALGVWWFGEGLGLIPTGAASPLTGAPGAVLLYALVGALVWPRSCRGGSVSKVGTAPVGTAPSWAGPLGRVIWAALWLLSAALWLLPANRAGAATHDALETAAYGWLTQAQHAAATAAQGNGLAIAIGLAVASILIALGALVPAATRPALAAGALLSLAYWAFGQSFGLITTGTATDLNAGPLFVLLALRLWGDPTRVDWRPLLVPSLRPRALARARRRATTTAPALYRPAGATTPLR
ncbi:MAG: hypothetical protein ACRDWW_09135 [Acidimicrobiales bacterium]